MLYLSLLLSTCLRSPELISVPHEPARLAVSVCIQPYLYSDMRQQKVALRLSSMLCNMSCTRPLLCSAGLVQLKRSAAVSPSFLLTHLLACWSSRSRIHSATCSLYSLISCFIFCLFVSLCACSFPPSIHPCSHPSVHPSIHPFLHPCIR